MSSATNTPASSAAPHAHHPNADSSVTFKGLAAYEKGGQVKAFEYNPVPLGPQMVDVEIQACGICGTDTHNIDCGWSVRATAQQIFHAHCALSLTYSSLVDTQGSE